MPHFSRNRYLKKFFQNNKNWPSYDGLKKKRYRFGGNTVYKNVLSIYLGLIFMVNLNMIGDRGLKYRSDRDL